MSTPLSSSPGSTDAQILMIATRRLLDAVDKDVTRVQDKITHGMKKVAWVIKKNEGNNILPPLPYAVPTADM